MSLESIDWDTRCAMKDAPAELVEPVRRLVSAAIEKLGDDYIDPREVRRFAYNKGDSYVEFFIQNLYPSVMLDDDPDQGASGLFITVNDYLSGKLIGQADIQTPCDPAMVNQEQIYLLRGLLPDSVNEAVEILNKAVPVRIIEGVFFEAHQAPYRLGTG